MQNNRKVLIVGDADRIEILSINIGYDITFLVNYEEATEQLSRATFGLVITDAELSGNGSGFDMVQLVQNMTPRPTLVVCHQNEICQVHDRDWNIPRSLGVCFKEFAMFHHGTITDYWSKRTSQLKKCA